MTWARGPRPHTRALGASPTKLDAPRAYIGYRAATAPRQLARTQPYCVRLGCGPSSRYAAFSFDTKSC
jgi:hypothetical protein